MLVQFAVQNYRSFKSEALLNLYPARSGIHSDHVLVSEEDGRRASALPVAVLYGANASGKSNLVSALATAQEIIVSNIKSGFALPVTPFLLADDTSSQPSRFEFVLKHDGVLYTYGFAATSSQIVEEWLFAVLNKREVKLFERVTRDDRAVVEPGNQLASTSREKQRLAFIAEGLQPNQLFLAEAVERNVELLAPLVHWFTHRLKIIHPDAKYTHLIPRAIDEPEFRQFLNDFLCAADTGIQSLKVISETQRTGRRPDDASAPDQVPDEILKYLASSQDHFAVYRVGKKLLGVHLDEDGDLEFLSLQTVHQLEDGASVSFSIEDESDGTHRMLHLAPALYNLHSTEDVYVIDEFDRSLHPGLCRAFLEGFLRSVTRSGCQGQIILTTHETSILSLDLLRRDEIWFVEKDLGGASHISSLAEFDVRQDLRIDKGYINGRFGAIPFVGDMARLFPVGGCD